MFTEIKEYLHISSTLWWFCLKTWLFYQNARNLNFLIENSCSCTDRDGITVNNGTACIVKGQPQEKYVSNEDCQNQVPELPSKLATVDEVRALSEEEFLSMGK